MYNNNHDIRNNCIPNDDRNIKHNSIHTRKYNINNANTCECKCNSQHNMKYNYDSTRNNSTHIP